MQAGREAVITLGQVVYFKCCVMGFIFIIFSFSLKSEILHLNVILAPVLLDTFPQECVLATFLDYHLCVYR